LRRRLATLCGGNAADRILHLASAMVAPKVDGKDQAVSADALRRLICEEYKDESWNDADVDLMVVAENAEETVLQTIGAIQRNLAKRGRESVVLRTKNTLTVVGGWPFPNVQVVCKTVRCIQELLVHSDVDCTALAYDGERVWAPPRALRAVACGYNFIPKQLLTSYGPRIERTQARFGKYYRRGFGLVVFEHCRHVPRCDHGPAPPALARLARIKQTREPKRLQGDPAQKGQALADWMLRMSPQLRRTRGQKK